MLNIRMALAWPGAPRPSALRPPVVSGVSSSPTVSGSRRRSGAKALGSLHSNMQKGAGGGAFSHTQPAPLQLYQGLGFGPAAPGPPPRSPGMHLPMRCQWKMPVPRQLQNNPSGLPPRAQGWLCASITGRHPVDDAMQGSAPPPAGSVPAPGRRSRKETQTPLVGLLSCSL